MNIYAAFETWAREMNLDVPERSPQWWLMLKAFVGGMGTGMGVPDDDDTLERLVACYQVADLELLFCRVPEEHRLTRPDGQTQFTEVGVVHVMTLLEEADPDRARGIRQLRYALLRLMQGRREGGHANG